MAQNYALIDTATGQLKNSGVTFATALAADQLFTSTGQTTFTVTAIFTSVQMVDVYAGGILTAESVSLDWTRNTSTNQITFNYTVPSGTQVRVRVWV